LVTTSIVRVTCASCKHSTVMRREDAIMRTADRRPGGAVPCGRCQAAATVETVVEDPDKILNPKFFDIENVEELRAIRLPRLWVVTRLKDWGKGEGDRAITDPDPVWAAYPPVKIDDASMVLYEAAAAHAERLQLTPYKAWAEHSELGAVFPRPVALWLDVPQAQTGAIPVEFLDTKSTGWTMRLASRKTIQGARRKPDAPRILI